MSVIIPTHNGIPLVEQCLRAILAQQTPWPFEVIAIDSGSTDGTWELLEALGIQRTQIAARDFNHGTTRNLAAGRARGEFLVFHVQDAIPANERWLTNLVRACQHSRVVGAYSRQRPRPESTPVTKFMVLGTTPDDEVREWKVLPPGVALAELPPVEQFRLSLFQNGSSCIRRSAWEAQPFAPVPYGEDLEWGSRAIAAGHALVYEPSSVVFHSHDRSPLYALKRAYADHSLVAQLFGWVLVPSLARAARSAAWGTVAAWRHIWRTADAWTTALPYCAAAPLFVGAQTLGQYLGPRMNARLTRCPWLRGVDGLLRAGV